MRRAAPLLPAPARSCPVPSSPRAPPESVALLTSRFFHLHLVSDATGETLIAAGRAAAAQHRDARAIQHVHPLVRSPAQVAAVLRAVDREPGIVLSTIVDRDLSALLERRCAEIRVPCVAVLEPVLTAFQSYLGTPARRRVGAQHDLDAAYFRRIEALDFTMEHDDGQLPPDIEDADVILLGVSRTSKTPTSIYLANRGVKTLNVPVVTGVPLPEAVLTAKRPLVVGLVATPDRIAQVRQHRPLGTAPSHDPALYADRARVAEELAHARRLFMRHGWPTIDVTRRSIEETAAAILTLREAHAARTGQAASYG